MPKIIHVLAFANVQVLDVTGPLQVFASANDLARQQGLPLPYAVNVIAAQAEPVMTSAGLALVAEPLPGAETPCDTLVIAGGWGVYGAAEDPQLVAWVRQKATQSRRMASVCTGAFLLAASGLLDGCRVATHWTRCEELARKYPRLQVEANPIFIQQGSLWTSAGVTAGIDLCLALVEEDLGRAVALDVARHLVVFLKRPGGQAQFSVTLSLQKGGSRFSELHAWIAEHLHLDLNIATLAAACGMSERSFVRHYRADTGQTPARAVELIRVETARRQLADSAVAIKRIAAQCGFGSEETMRRSFIRALSITPQLYRERFSAPA
ncbi:Transcriptional regulator GlxA family, contains an amidase domain and an AraC-type DNA-binding HTH domain [Pseudomonas gessardii]|uniref:Helix-turn-helix domain-containing protein n=1 Tax=Pseudomonas gessardii TaxID=78544 RepID=A0A7Y1MRY0_9PSED|nr:DJ-1/PfpI family protein [Pseudomonas gessardii]MCF4979972.1 helix-turn-helix domain-containing protein [Pseudomonas gessardii]MCF4993051.1 helix-turn-helix domain-containing protein [Pseudomonas gessardii]MCF5087280.1 helix-turn-helix domain-containing protein [Pseudomonas gessardii]MCF5098879.1 helix-turn-helix domain-containing protein [Pseudomonas gessardii]MCF5107399.1 helix-turn-helix domain-containing protein [Pseudomonas gessardii]